MDSKEKYLCSLISLQQIIIIPTEYLIFFVCNLTNLELPNEIRLALTLVNKQAISSSNKSIWSSKNAHTHQEETTLRF